MISTDLVIEQTLTQRAQQGDAQALAELCQRHASGVFRYSRRPA